MASGARAEWNRLARSRITSYLPWKLSVRRVRQVWRHIGWRTWFNRVLRRRPAAAFRPPASGVLRAAVGADSYRAAVGGEPADDGGADSARAGPRGRDGGAAGGGDGARAAPPVLPI